MFAGKDMNELKQELELDVHKVDVEELCKRFNTNLDNGLTKQGADENRDPFYEILSWPKLFG
jgi:hypothetical protein